MQQKNMSPTSVAAWKRTFKEIAATFGPMKERFAKLGRGVAERIERHGNKAKARLLRFVDIILVDDRLLQALEFGEWAQCIAHRKHAVVKENVIDAESCAQCRKIALFCL